MKLPFTIYDSRLTICKKSAGGTGVAPVVSGVAPETRPQGKAALHFASHDCAVPSQIRRDAGFERRDACSTRFVFNRQSSIVNHKSRRGFTMVEIALCLAIIGFALVVIIGLLPRGMNAQRENRERTIINQDATVFVEAIRNGARGADDLVNYVYQIVNYQTAFPSLAPSTFAYSNFTSGANIVGLLSTPEFTDINGLALPNLTGGGVSNHIVAYVRSMSGSAVEKPPQNNTLLVQGSFTYRVICENVPVVVAPNSSYSTNLAANLHDLQLTFLWPQLPNGNLPPQHPSQPYRTLIAGRQVMDANTVPGTNLYFFQPQFFTNAP